MALFVFVNNVHGEGCGTNARNYMANENAFTGSFCASGDPIPSLPAFPNSGETVTWQCPSSGELEWIIRKAPEDNSWNSVTYGNGMFVAVTGYGQNRIMTSPDGVNWTARKAPEDNNWTSVAYGNGMFVATGYDAIMTSPDGINWTTRKSPGNNGWHYVTYGNGMFVGFSSHHIEKRIMTSYDGINWTVRQPFGNSGWRSVAYGNDMFVAVASFGQNRIMTALTTPITCQASKEASSSACGPSSGKSFIHAPTTGLCNSGVATAATIRANVKDCWDTMCPSGIGCTHPDRHWHWYCGDSQCHATDPNAEYKSFFGASEIESYTGSFPKPDTVTVWMEQFCHRVHKVPGYEVVSCSYDDKSGTHGGCHCCVMSRVVFKKKPELTESGVCGSLNRKIVQSAPSQNLCSKGTASRVYGTGPWIWLCVGNNEGATVPCFSLKGEGTSFEACNLQYDPVCGIDGKTYSNECFARKANIQIKNKGECVVKKNALCGLSHNQLLFSSPIKDLCIAGTPTTVSGKGPWTWTCKGINGGADAQCRSELAAPQCGSAHKITTSSAPVKDLCIGQTQGIFVKNDQDGNWTWNCGQNTCNATDPNREYKKKFKALEMAEYTGNPSDPDTAKIAIQNYHCNWLPMGLGAYSKVSCKYEPVGSHGGGNCPECSVVLFEVKKK